MAVRERRTAAAAAVAAGGELRGLEPSRHRSLGADLLLELSKRGRSGVAHGKGRAASLGVVGAAVTILLASSVAPASLSNLTTARAGAGGRTAELLLLLLLRCELGELQHLGYAKGRLLGTRHVLVGAAITVQLAGVIAPALRDRVLSTAVARASSALSGGTKGRELLLLRELL